MWQHSHQRERACDVELAVATWWRDQTFEWPRCWAPGNEGRKQLTGRSQRRERARPAARAKSHSMSWRPDRQPRRYSQRGPTGCGGPLPPLTPTPPGAPAPMPPSARNRPSPGWRRGIPSNHRHHTAGQPSYACSPLDDCQPPCAMPTASQHLV